MNEASVLMPRLFDFGMYYGHPLCVLQDKLRYVSMMLRNSQIRNSHYQIAENLSDIRGVKCHK